MACSDWPKGVRFSTHQPIAKQTSMIQTGVPIVASRPVPSTSKTRNPSICGWSLPSCVMRKTRPRTPVSPASVTMNGGSRSHEMTTPCTRPTSAAAPSPAPIAAQEPYRAADAERMTASAYVDPTDRSMPPLMITNVMPAAMMPMNDAARATLRRLSAEPNDGTVTTPSTTTSSSTATAPLRDTIDVSERRRSAAARTPGSSAGVVTTPWLLVLLGLLMTLSSSLRWTNTAVTMIAASTMRATESGTLCDTRVVSSRLDQHRPRDGAEDAHSAAVQRGAADHDGGDGAGSKSRPMYDGSLARSRAVAMTPATAASPPDSA
ncbi:hypothetical protein GCM10025868_00930 [Angustibacter aerolatus]|uniref:Uncharacterized protein n=1 Tax=Angustibacter aerolatus TaxID=1162965 RepID=A0ABQ6JBK4_9ACTN|nr:hypothetical protein GCM10025868_00930 [Angustibacter aerolatus]